MTLLLVGLAVVLLLLLLLLLLFWDRPSPPPPPMLHTLNVRVEGIDEVDHITVWGRPVDCGEDCNWCCLARVRDTLVVTGQIPATACDLYTVVLSLHSPQVVTGWLAMPDIGGPCSRNAYEFKNEFMQEPLDFNLAVNVSE